MEGGDWKSPAEIMKRRGLKRKKARTENLDTDIIISPHKRSPGNRRYNLLSQKRKNPFANRKSVGNAIETPSGCEAVNGDSHSQLLQSLEIYSNENSGSCKSKTVPIKQLFPTVKRPNVDLDYSQIVVKTQKSKQWFSFFPYDWALKSKLRFMSDAPFNTVLSTDPLVECKGVEQFVRGSTHEPERDEVCLQRCLQYWIHPSLPWLNLFPRALPSKLHGTSFLLTDKDMHKQVMDDWTSSMLSLFDMLQYGHCPYFYVCSNWTTILFRAGIEGREMDAVITPTTRGLRETFKSEGIEFKLMEQAHLTQQTTADNKLAFHKSDDEDEVDENEENAAPAEDLAAAGDWLKTLGIDKKYKSLKPENVKLEGDNYQTIDNRQESAVFVSGPDVVSLFNYLVNCRSLISTTGPLAGVPPTLLAPHAYKGATLRSLKVKSSFIGATQTASSSHILEVSGPVLPSHAAQLTQLLSRLHTKFNLHSNVLEYTAPFNVCPNSKVNSENYDEQLNQLQSKSGAAHVQLSSTNSCRAALNDLQLSDNLFSWF